MMTRILPICLFVCAIVSSVAPVFAAQQAHFRMPALAPAMTKFLERLLPAIQLPIALLQFQIVTAEFGAPIQFDRSS